MSEKATTNSLFDDVLKLLPKRPSKLDDMNNMIDWRPVKTLLNKHMKRVAKASRNKPLTEEERGRNKVISATRSAKTCQNCAEKKKFLFKYFKNSNIAMVSICDSMAR